MIVAERETPQGLLVAVCDSEVLGETFEDGEVSLTVTEEFYGGDRADHGAVVDALSRASVANLVGVDAVSLAVEHGFVDRENVLEIDGTMHANYLRLDR